MGPRQAPPDRSLRRKLGLRTPEGRDTLTDTISVFELGRWGYEPACRLQRSLAAARARDEVGDLLLLVEHPPVITVGQGGGWEDLLVPIERLQQEGIQVVPTDRGGKATYHGPGQLVAYPIFRVPSGGLHGFVEQLEEVVIRLLHTYGLNAGRVEKHPGVWIGDAKIAALGLAVSDGVTRHGLALNVSPQMAHFSLLIPCGITDLGTTSMERELGAQPDLDEVTRRFVQSFGEVFGRPVHWQTPAIQTQPVPPSPPSGGNGGTAAQPPWLWQRLSPHAEKAAEQVERLLKDCSLHTVCQEARCPNLAECFAQGTATFLILGDHCTRGCRFCAIHHGRPSPPDPHEPERVAQAAAQLGLRHVVITSVTRDDLPDGGSSHFVATIQAVRQRLPSATVEVLIPDFGGSLPALQAVLEAAPEVLNHNLETAPRLYPTVRPGADYHRSLTLLRRAKSLWPQAITKSGLMLGLGERTAEVLHALQDLREVQCDLLTLGQYLQPTDDQLPIARYVPPEEFEEYRVKAIEMGFRGVASGPLVRSSHQARALLERCGLVQPAPV